MRDDVYFVLMCYFQRKHKRKDCLNKNWHVFPDIVSKDEWFYLSPSFASQENDTQHKIKKILLDSFDMSSFMRFDYLKVFNLLNRYRIKDH